LGPKEKSARGKKKTNASSETAEQLGNTQGKIKWRQGRAKRGSTGEWACSFHGRKGKEGGWKEEEEITKKTVGGIGIKIHPLPGKWGQTSSNNKKKQVGERVTPNKTRGVGGQKKYENAGTLKKKKKAVVGTRGTGKGGGHTKGKKDGKRKGGNNKIRNIFLKLEEKDKYSRTGKKGVYGSKKTEKKRKGAV